MQRKTSITWILFLLLYSSYAQVSLPSAPVGTSHTGALVVYTSNTVDLNKHIPYERIGGSPFWKSEYQLATIIDLKNQVLGKAPAKLNLYTNELYFLTPKEKKE